MAYQYSVAARNAALDAIETTTGVSPTLELRTGAPPATAATADSGTVVATMALPSDWAAAAAAGAKALAGTWQDLAADASGRVGHFRIKQGATTHIQGLVSDAWQASRAYAVGDQVTNGGNLYRATAAGTSAGSGGPSGTGASITDGGVTWTFVQVGSDISLNNATVNAGQLVNITAFTMTAGGA
jgi:hypothetical protein